MTNLTDRAHEITIRRAAEAAERLAQWTAGRQDGRPSPGGRMTTDGMSPYSDAALARQRLVDEKIARGEQVAWSDLFGIIEPNPNLPDCQAWEDDHKCQLPNHHDGPHRAVIEWGGSGRTAH